MGASPSQQQEIWGWEIIKVRKLGFGKQIPELLAQPDS